MTHDTVDMTELQRERAMGAMGTESDREVRRISLADLSSRRSEITDELWSAATDIGFFQVVDHGIDLADVRAAFTMAERFFALPDEDLRGVLATTGNVVPADMTGDDLFTNEFSDPSIAAN